MFVQQPQQTYAGGQGGVVIIQPSSAVTTTTHGYTMAGQQPVYVPQQVSTLYYMYIKLYNLVLETILISDLRLKF